MSGEGLAAVIASCATLCTAVGSIVIQVVQLKLSQSNAEKLKDIHASTVAIQEQTGVFKKIDG